MTTTLQFRNDEFYHLCGELAEQAPEFFAARVHQPVFIIGAPRSGTTLLLKLLAAHPEVIAFRREANEYWHPRFYPWRNCDETVNVPPYEIDPKAFTEASVRQFSAVDEQRLRALFGVAQVLGRGRQVIGKSAMLSLMVPQILQRFSDARLVHVVRDGRAAACSRAIKEHDKMRRYEPVYRRRGVYRSFDELLTDVARSWASAVEAVMQEDQVLELSSGGRLLTIYYEQLCADPDRQLSRLQEWLGLSQPVRCPDALRPRSRNSKYRQVLPTATISRLERLMAGSLRRAGYPVGPFEEERA